MPAPLSPLAVVVPGGVAFGESLSVIREIKKSKLSL